MALLTADRLMAARTPHSPSCSHGRPQAQGRNQTSLQLLFPPFDTTLPPNLCSGAITLTKPTRRPRHSASGVGHAEHHLRWYPTFSAKCLEQEITMDPTKT